MPLFAVDFELIGQVIWVSLAAGIGVSVLFSLVILTAARATEMRRAGNGGAAVGYTALAVFTFAVFATGVVIGVQVMLTK